MPHDPFPTQVLLDSVASALASEAKPMHDLALVPSVFTIALSHEAFDEIEPIQPVLRSQVMRRLDDELARLNASAQRESIWKRMLRWFTRSAPKHQMYDRGGAAWTVQFTPHDDPARPRNEFLIYTAFATGEGPQRLETAGQTVRLDAVPSPPPATDQSRTVVAPVSPSSAMAEGQPLAWIRYSDDEGDHELPFGSGYRTRSAKIGRVVDGTDWVEIPVAVKENVSRDHARLKYDPEAQRFFLLDTSQFGTSLDGEKVPNSHGRVADQWVPVPTAAEISLAGTVTLRFEQAMDSTQPSPDTTTRPDPHSDAPSP